MGCEEEKSNEKKLYNQMDEDVEEPNNGNKALKR